MIARTLLHYMAVRLGTHRPHTQTSAAERQVLRRFLPGRKRIVEIGVFEGFTTRMLAEHCDDDAEIWGVDPFLAGRLGISWGKRIAIHANRRHLASGRLKLVECRSTDVGDRVPACVDYVFVDADHSFAAAEADWAFWSRKLVSGGIIALHDSRGGPGEAPQVELGSQRYFKSHVRHDRRFEIVDQRGTLSVLRKF